MGNGRAEWAFGCAYRIRVDPLRVVGRLGEPIDALLVDLEPLGRPELLADQVRQRAHAGPQRTTLAAHV